MVISKQSSLGTSSTSSLGINLKNGSGQLSVWVHRRLLDGGLLPYVLFPIIAGTAISKKDRAVRTYKAWVYHSRQPGVIDYDDVRLLTPCSSFVGSYLAGEDPESNAPWLLANDLFRGHKRRAIVRQYQNWLKSTFWEAFIEGFAMDTFYTRSFSSWPEGLKEWKIASQ